MIGILNGEEIVVMTDTRKTASRMIVLEVEHLEGNEDVRVANPFFSGYGISIKMELGTNLGRLCDREGNDVRRRPQHIVQINIIHRIVDYS